MRVRTINMTLCIHTYSRVQEIKLIDVQWKVLLQIWGFVCGEEKRNAKINWKHYWGFTFTQCIDVHGGGSGGSPSLKRKSYFVNKLIYLLLRPKYWTFPSLKVWPVHMYDPMHTYLHQYRLRVSAIHYIIWRGGNGVTWVREKWLNQCCFGITKA